MNLKSKIFISALALASMTAQAAPVANAPEIIKLPAMVNVLSDNGLWGVYEKASVTDGTLAPSGAVIVNMLTYQTTDVSHSSGISGATDITNDGKIIVGNVAGVPAYYSTDAGMWILLPLPQGYNGGGLNSVTPDGHYAVGYVNPASSAFKAYPVMYDLTTNSLIDLPNLPELDMQHENMEQNAVYQISADGRYLVGMLSQSYMLPAQLCTYVYDRQNATYKMIGFEPSDTQDWTPRWEDLFFVEGPVMSSNGKYVTGAAYIVEEVPGSEYPTEYNAAFLYDVEKDTFEVYNKHGENDYIGMNLLNDGTVICANPATNPYAYTSVRYGNYNIDLAQILRDNYGINFKEATGYLNTGKAISVSDDGMTILLMPDPDGDRVLMKLKEPIQEAAAKVNLLSNYAATPAAGSIMSQLKTVTVTFAREIEANSSASGIVCQSEDGTDKWNPLQSGGLRVEGSTATITFRSRDLREGVKYTLTIPAGTLRIKGDREMTNPEINITYTGRSKAPVKVTKVYPAEGASLAELNASTSPVLLTFDSSLKLAEGAQGELYRSGENTPFATLSFQMANDHQAYAYPTAAQHLFKGTDYTVVIPEGCFTDLSGNGPNEEYSVTYHGIYVREISSDDKYLFTSDCNLYDDFILYEGDHNAPAAVPSSWKFTADLPWGRIQESEDNNDVCMGSHSMYLPKGKSDDWMSLPRLFIPDTDCYLQFDAQSYKKDKNDVLNIYVYPCSNGYESFTPEIIAAFRAGADKVFSEKLDPGASEENLSGDWKNYRVPLSKYAGKDVYIAFVNENEDQSAIFVDNVQVIHDMSFLTTLTTKDRVVNQESVPVNGVITIASEVETYNDATLVLADSEGKEIDRISQTGLNLKKGDTYNFSFTKELPLALGTATTYTVTATLGQRTSAAAGEVHNLTFEPVKHIVLEEFSGATCSNCPLGFLAIDHINELYPGTLIPILVRTYQGDALGAGMSGYSEFLGLTAAPSARINRGEALSPMVSNMGDYMFSGAGLKDSQTGEDIVCWTDRVTEEMAKPADAEINLTSSYDTEKGIANITCEVRSALDTDTYPLNIFAVIRENKLITSQSNGFAGLNDPDLGDWGLGGKYGRGTVWPFEINEVARGTYGTTYNGTGGLLPESMKAGEVYTVPLQLSVPATVAEPANCDAVVMLIDPVKGTVVNANYVSLGAPLSVGTLTQTALSAKVMAGNVVVSGKGNLAAAVYTPAGQLLAQGNGRDNLTLPLSGFTGIAIVRATDAEGHTVVKKISVR